MRTMRKNEFIAELARRSGVAPDAVESLLKAQAKLVCDELVKNGGVNFPGFGKMKLITYKTLPERKGVNPRTGEATVIPARANRVFPKMKLGKEFEETLSTASLVAVAVVESAPDEG